MNPRKLFDAACANGGLRFAVASHGKAVHARQRLYSWRKSEHDRLRLLAERDGLAPSEPYAGIRLTLETPDGTQIKGFRKDEIPVGPVHVVFHLDDDGEILDKDGNPIELDFDDPEPEIDPEVLRRLDFDLGE